MRSEVELRLPTVKRSDDVEVEIRIAGTGALPGPAVLREWHRPHPQRYLWKAAAPGGGEYLRLHYGNPAHLVEIVIGPGGREVWVAWSPGLPIENISALILGPVFPCLVQLMGNTALHGSVVAYDGRAIVMIGASGAGKSTTALACIQRGASLVADDLAIIADEGSEFSVRRGTMSMRLRSNTADTMTDGFDALRPIWAAVTAEPQKRFLDFPPQLSAGSACVPLAGIVVLGKRNGSDTEPHLTTLTGAVALGELMAQRSADSVLDRTQHLRDMALLTRLLAVVPVRALHRPEGLDRVGDVAELILRDAPTAA
jgi:HPr Serine kinase C-terminal domain